MAGFLCRWTLLALACAMLPLAAAVGWYGVATIAAELRAEVRLPDAIWGRVEGALLEGYFRPDPSPGVRGLLFSVCDGSEPRWAWAGKSRFWARPAAPVSGDNLVDLLGSPYGPYAFHREQALLRVVPPGRRACLIEAGLMLGVQPDQAASLLAAVRSRWDAAVLYDGPPDDFPEVRAALRRIDDTVPILMHVPGAPDPIAVLKRARGTLGRAPKQAGDPLVVTGRLELADGAAGLGLETHLIAAVPAANGDRFRRHESTAKFKDWLASRPISP